MNTSSKDPHANDSWTFGSERVVFEIEHAAGIHQRFSLFFLQGGFGCFLPFLKRIHDVVDDGAGDEFHLGVIVVTDLHDKTFYAELHLVANGAPTVVSCRPSDGLALAVRTGTPIYVSDAVIAEVGFVDGAEPGTDDQPEEMVEEFKEFLDTISPEDFED